MAQGKSIPAHPLEWMNRSLWGSLKWAELHGRALAYLPMEGEEEWFASFLESIPCPHCQKHFRAYIEKNPPDFSTRPAFFKWTVDAHNSVNARNCKPILTMKEALEANWKAVVDLEN